MPQHITQLPSNNGVRTPSPRQGIAETFRPLRRTEGKEFVSWLRWENGRRTVIVGWILFAFAMVGLLASQLGLDETAPQIYIVAALALSLGAILTLTARRLYSEQLSTLGEGIILLAAVGWMFASVHDRVHVGFGLPEFIIGLLGLALLRYMRPRLGALVFPLLGVCYGLTLYWNGRFEFLAWINGMLFCGFALVWSVMAYRSRMTEFQKEKLLEELNHRNEQLNALALRDPLTGLPNRRFFDQLLEERWKSFYDREAPVSLVIADIDHFKSYNDTYGHPAGDDCLKSVGRVLAACVRADDSAVRLGGEEFGVLLLHASIEDAEELARTVRKEVEEEGTVTVSLGVSSVTPSRATPEELYRLADTALYAAKAEGRNRTRVEV